jgi:hypothetical protein
MVGFCVLVTSPQLAAPGQPDGDGAGEGVSFYMI